MKTLRSLGTWRKAAAVSFAAALLAAFGSAASTGTAAKFYNDDPIGREPETQDASGVAALKIDLMYDIVLNQFARPGTPPGSRAQNINTIDEVPDSNWFTNRILAKPFSIDELTRGPHTVDGVAPGQLTIIRAKTEGDAPGFTIRDTKGVVWFVAFDPPSNPEAASGAAVIANKIFWALGYYQAEFHLGELTREQLVVDENATFAPPSGRVRPMKLHDIDPVLSRAARNANGTYRFQASRLLPGKILGGFKYHGTRSDDPNDVVPHEQRRELRALHVFGAWTNLVDIKALNTMDTLITEDGKSRVRHWLLDIGSTFGIGANGPRDWTDGYEYFFEKDKTLKRLYTLGFYLQPWQTVKYQENKSIGRFEGDEFDPLLWKSRFPAGALLRIRDDDAFWAARRVMAFSDDMIRAVVKTGKYSDPEAEKLLAEVLIKRRNKIGQTYYNRINPLVNFTLQSGVLRFENAAVQAGFGKAPSGYKTAWSVLDNATGTTSAIAETSGAGDGVAAPQSMPSSEGTFIVAEVRAALSENAPWNRPVRTTFRRMHGAWKLVGLERMP
jgi:hypothetical protein